ncbi:MAG: amino acid permease [Simkania sp.]|nr:amino acid permease [Simkania sp.]
MSKLFHSCGHVVGGSLLIAGTMIGVGMLALPVATAPGGFLPSLSLYLICWLFMLCTGLLVLEICIWMPKDANMITMASKLLGTPGKIVCWIVYLFLFLTVMIAHVAGGGDILNEIFNQSLTGWASKVLYVAIFIPVVYLGTRSVDRVNMILIAGLIISYILFVNTSIGHVNISHLKRTDWSKAWFTLPILFTAFTYQVILPTIMNYMNRNVKKVRLAIFIGTSIPLIVYVLWEFLILGTVPFEGPNSLSEAAAQGQTAVIPLKAITKNPHLFSIGKAFGFFTLTASYLALALAYLDFLADGLKVKKSSWNKLWLCLLIFVPPTVITLVYPKIFLTALGYAGGYSCAILFGLFPPLMAWSGRHYKHYQDKTKQLFGGRYFLTILIIFVVSEILLETVNTLIQ